MDDAPSRQPLRPEKGWQSRWTTLLLSGALVGVSASASAQPAGEPGPAPGVSPGATPPSASSAAPAVPPAAPTGGADADAPRSPSTPAPPPASASAGTAGDAQPSEPTEHASSRADAPKARVEIRTTDGKGTVVLDGRVVGEGSFEGAIDAGPHSLEVRRVGFTSHSRTIELRPGQLYVETVQLALDAAEPEPVLNRTRVLSGLYGGLELAAMFLPGGSGATLETGCDRLGASECDSPTPWGPLLGAYFGYAFDPIGLELFAAGLADYTMPTARFDGRLGSELNPLVAAPARSEEFLIFRAGLVAAIRLRATVDFEVVRLAFAGGIGLSYRKMWMRREGQAEDGTDAKSDFVPDPVEYLSPGLSLQLALGLPVSTVTQLSLGLAFWGETARTDARTTPDDVMLVSDSGSSLPRPEHTPAYDLARGPQLYLGPVLGLQFGP